MTQSPLEAAALQAWEQHQADEAAEDEAAEQAQVDAARAHLSSTLGTDVSGLTVAEATQGDGWVLTVFTDGALYLSVRKREDFEIRLSTPTDTGGWRDGPVISSLWELGKVLASREPQSTAPEWAAGVAYAVGDRVTFEGVVYECVKAHTSKAGDTPPNKTDQWVMV